MGAWFSRTPARPTRHSNSAWADRAYAAKNEAYEQAVAAKTEAIAAKNEAIKRADAADRQLVMQRTSHVQEL